ncbi:methionine--tRNA ligase [Gammaproteobacteria bacterium]|nr:methionine--tRNA ligase [Gammaproteobacteria bacterium]MDC0441081.1 methionine--tRNA ligase [Gammaproteobacteria bacterium]
MNKSRKIIVTNALPYANGDIHVGHILEHIQTNIWSRFMKLTNNEVLTFCADDAHGAPIMMKADELGVNATDFIDEVKINHEKSLAKYGIEYTNYHSTHSQENETLINEIYNDAQSAGYIYKKEIEQCFDEEKQMFLADRYVVGDCPKCSAKNQYGDGCEVCGATYSATELLNPQSSLSKTVPTTKTSEHIFFDLEKAKSNLVQFLDTVSIQKSILGKLSEWIDGDLKSWDISRDKPYFGFKIPAEKDKYFYVWVDAPIGYMATASNWASQNSESIESLWGKDSEYEIHHFIGKDITYFHGLFWPALLMESKYKLPNSIHVHGFVTVNGEKMSKSKGTFITADQFADACDPELLRYYFASKLNSKIEDLDLNFEDLAQKVNSDLVGKFSNIFSRSAPFISKNDGFLSKEIHKEHLSSSYQFIDEILIHYEKKEFSKAIKLIMQIADETNKYINEHTPWKLDKNEAAIIATTALNVFKNLCILLSPVTPILCKKMLSMLNIDNLEIENLEKELKDCEINEFKPILSRVKPLNIQDFYEKEEKMNEEDNNIIQIDDFMKVDLRVAKVEEASHVEGADKLLAIKLDLGDLGTKNVFAGIKSAYEPSQLEGKLVVMVYNLAPRKMKFGLSEGMILAASDSDGGIFVLSPDLGAKPGQKIK